MKVLVTGASGLIGSAVTARLSDEGHEVTALVRSSASPVPPGARHSIELDFADAPAAADWLSHLQGIDVVVNCAGVLQDNPRDRTSEVHVTGAAALFEACERQGIRRVIHLSAIGADREQISDFSATKYAGDKALMALDLDWVILRPSVVLGRSVFGASALVRGLAALPLFPIIPGTGPLQVVQLNDVVATVSFFLRPEAPARLELELAGPQKLSFGELVASYRRWLGWPPARTVPVPQFLASILFRLGDTAGALGWRPPMRTTARREILRGAVGDPRGWTGTTGIVPAALPDALAAEPATVQERWFAQLYLLKVAIFVVLPFFWVGTGVISLTSGYDIGVDLMRRAGAGVLAGPGVVAGAIADICVGLAIAYRPTARSGLYGALALSAFYLITGWILLPELWSEPLGPLMKILPIFVLHLVALAVWDER